MLDLEGVQCMRVRTARLGYAAGTIRAVTAAGTDSPSNIGTPMDERRNDRAIVMLLLCRGGYRLLDTTDDDRPDTPPLPTGLAHQMLS